MLDKQDLMKERQKDLKFLTEEEYWKLQIFFANGIYICVTVFYSLEILHLSVTIPVNSFILNKKAP